MSSIGDVQCVCVWEVMQGSVCGKIVVIVRYKFYWLLAFFFIRWTDNILSWTGAFATYLWYQL